MKCEPTHHPRSPATSPPELSRFHGHDSLWCDLFHHLLTCQRSHGRSKLLQVPKPPLLSGGELCFCCVLQRHPVSPALLWCVRSTPLSSTNLIDTSILFQSKPMFGSMKNHSKRHAFDQSANRSSLSRFRDFFWSLFLSSRAIDLRTHHNTKKNHKIFDPAVSATCFLSYVDEAHFVSRRNPEQYSCWSAGTT